MGKGTVVFFSPGILTDAGGIEIYVGADGQLHIRRVPGWNPEVIKEVLAAVEVMNQASKLTDAGVVQRFQQFAEGVINNRSRELTGYLNQVGQAAA